LRGVFCVQMQHRACTLSSKPHRTHLLPRQNLAASDSTSLHQRQNRIDANRRLRLLPVCSSYRTLPKLQMIFWVLPNLLGVAQFTRTNPCSSCENLRASRSLTHVSLSALYSVYTLRSLHSKLPALPLDLPL